MADKKVLIVGAGLGGLAAASCLMKAGYDVAVYEQAPALAEVGAGIQMSANPMHVLRHLGIEDEALKMGVKPGGYVFRLHDTGEIIQQFSLAAEHEKQHGAPYVQLHRADVLNTDDLRDAVRAVARYRDVRLRPISTEVVGYGKVGQAKWAAWRRRYRMETVSEELLDDQMKLIADILDPILSN